MADVAATNAQLAGQLSQLATNWNQSQDQFSNWLAGHRYRRNAGGRCHGRRRLLSADERGGRCPLLRLPGRD